MTLLLENETQEQIQEKLIDLLKNVMKIALESENKGTDWEISMLFVDNAEIKSLNQKFREMDAPTDVLSFPQLSWQEGEWIEKNDCGETLLGDIVISLERAHEQALEYGHSFEREMAFLTAHSMLHLLGYDHMVKEEEVEMFQKQKEILIKAGVPRRGEAEIK